MFTRARAARELSAAGTVCEACPQRDATRIVLCWIYPGCAGRGVVVGGLALATAVGSIKKSAHHRDDTAKRRGAALHSFLDGCHRSPPALARGGRGSRRVC